MEDDQFASGIPGVSSSPTRGGEEPPAHPADAGQKGAEQNDQSGSQPSRLAPAESDFFATVRLAGRATISTSSDGDLWPSTWADDGGLYAACGDGAGFFTPPSQDPAAPWPGTNGADVVVNRIDGTPESGLTGEALAIGRAVAPIWTDPEQYNSKPTGMIAVDGDGDGRDELYLAVQDLRCGDSPDTFNIAPAAGIVCSRDYGRTFTPGKQMFAGDFTTIFFLDFGQSNSGAASLRDLESRIRSAAAGQAEAESEPESDSEYPAHSAAEASSRGASGTGDDRGDDPDDDLSDDPAGYVYAYGIDGNWRTSYSGAVPDPTDLYLARVPIGSIQDRAAWQFYAGPANQAGPATQDSSVSQRTPAEQTGLSGQGQTPPGLHLPRWSSDITERVPVLTDYTRVGETPPAPGAPAPVSGTRIAQGGVVYNAPLKRYLYTSWTEFTFEFYESPTPWGPWRHFLSHDFGPFPWIGPNSEDGYHGGYGTTIPSKFISGDGTHMYVQSNWFVGASSYSGSSYHFSLRPLELAPALADSGSPAAQSTAQPAPDPVAPAPPAPNPTTDSNLALRPDAVPIARATRSGHIEVLCDSSTKWSEDSWNGERKPLDFWGYTWARPITCTRLVYTSGPLDRNGGFFAEVPQIQVREGALWRTIERVSVDPPYQADWTMTAQRTFTFTFDPVSTTGIRMIGPAGGWACYTAISELAIYNDAGAR